MAEAPATTPTDVAPEAPSSWDDKLAAKLGTTAEESDAAPPEPTPEGELAPDDVLAEEAAPEPEGEWLELDRKGEKRKVSKEEAKRLAQQGWDYNTNQEQLKSERALIAQAKAALVAKVQLTPLVMDAAGNVKYYERALQQYQTFDWVAYAQTADPQAYQAAKAQFEQLKEGYNTARYQFDQVTNAVQAADTQVNQAELQQSYTRILDAAPELRDPVRYRAEAERITGYLRGQGITEQEISTLADSRLLLIARDAMRYRAALQAKAERGKNGSPSLRPGPAPVRQTADDRAREVVKKLHQAKDPAQKKSLFDAALAAKLDRLA